MQFESTRSIYPKTNIVLPYICIGKYRRSQWPSGLRHKPSSSSRTLDLISNLTQGMHVCVRLFCVCVVLCVDNGLETG
jgi:hypothetical protein